MSDGPGGRSHVGATLGSPQEQPPPVTQRDAPGTRAPLLEAVGLAECRARPGLRWGCPSLCRFLVRGRLFSSFSAEEFLDRDLRSVSLNRTGS